MTSPAPVSWKSAVSGSWNTAADWSGGAVPNAASDVMIAVAGAYTVALNSAAAIHSLTLSDTAATLTIAAPAATVQIAGGLTNSGWVDIDTADYGGTTVKIGGTLTNSGYLTIGDAASAGVTSPTLVSAGGLANTGHITLWGPDATVLDINAAAALGGTIELHGNSTLEFATGAITAIAAGTMLTEDSGAASVALAADVYTPNSALTTLAGNAGTLAFENGANLATTVDFTNAAGALVEIDATGSGGSSLAIGGLLTNKGTIEVGNTGLIADAALAAAAVQNTGLIYFESDTGAANLSVTGDFTNASGGAVYVDTYYRDAGGSYLDIGGTLTNNGGFYIGSGASPTSVTANAVVNGATLELANGAALVVDAGLTNSGYLYVNSYYYNNTGGGGSLYVGGTLTNKGDVYIGYYGSNSAATTVSAAAVANSGFLDLYSGNAAASLSVTGAFGNSGTVEVDYGGNGGSTLKIGGTLTNSGYFYIGYTSLTKPTLVTAASLANTGYIELMGGAAAATLDITGVAPTTLGGNVYVLGDALFEFGSGAVTGIASGAALTVDGAQARVALSTTPASNSALTGLASNAGTFDLADGAALATTVGLTNTGAVYVDSYYYDQNKGGSKFAIGGTLTNKGDVYIGYYGSNSAATTVSAAALTNQQFLDLYSGSAAASLSVTGAFGNSGTVEVDYGGNGGSTLKIGGTLTNSGYFYIGYTSLTKPTLVTAAALANTGTIDLVGGSAAAATLDITGVAPAALSGYLYLAGDALFEFGGGAVTGIASGAQVTLNGAKALIALSTATTGNSALTGLASNAGYFYLDGGASLAVTGGFTNNYVFGVDQSGAGGSSFSVAAALANSSGDTIYAGNGGLTAAGKITAASLANNGYLYLQGGADSATETLSLAGASSDAGYMVVYPGGVLALGGTLTVTGTLYVDGGTVSGGTLAAAGSGLIEGAGTATLSNVTIARGASFIALSGSTLVDNGITVNGALSGSGAATLAFAKTGTDSLANVSGFAAITLANGAANTLNLAAANFAGISTGRITIADGNAGNSVTAANLPAADASLLHAGSGADTLTGGAGNDVFYAGGDTAMTGGGGANQFVFAAPGSNTISDFHFSSANALVFSNAGFNLGLSGATATPQAMSASQAASLFTENSSGAFTSAAQRLAYDTSNGQLFASAGGSSSTPKLVATLSDHAAIAASQLFFIS